GCSQNAPAVSQGLRMAVFAFCWLLPSPLPSSELGAKKTIPFPALVVCLLTPTSPARVWVVLVPVNWTPPSFWSKVPPNPPVSVIRSPDCQRFTVVHCQPAMPLSSQLQPVFRACPLPKGSS